MRLKPTLRIPLTDEGVGTLPRAPGVYLFRGEGGGVLYVGKAVRLRDRLRAYLRPATHSFRIDRRKKEIESIEVYLTANEREAYLLEDILIKRHRPTLNVRFRDDKSYPYLRVSVQEPFPKLSVVRRRLPDGARYFGPYPRSRELHATISLLQDFFQLATCRINITGKEARACLEYQLHRCSAPCIAAISLPEYRESVEQALIFLEGKYSELHRRVERAMEKEAAQLHFERAARLRDALQDLQHYRERQHVLLKQPLDCDVAGWAEGEGEGVLALHKIREGKLIAVETVCFELPCAFDAAKWNRGEKRPPIQNEPSRWLGEALLRYYAVQEGWAPLLLLPFSIVEAEELQELAEQRGSPLQATVPKRGVRRALVRQAEENAKAQLSLQLSQASAHRRRREQGLDSLEKALHLAAPPRRMECIDIAHFQGDATVGSLVVFEEGAPTPKKYRRYRMAQEANNDVEAMAEVVRRRLARGKEEGILPDLLVLDGGTPQWHAASRVAHELGVNVPLVALAKREELLIIGKETLRLSWSDPGLKLLQHLRDEAHRFANRCHRERLQKKLLSSSLDQVEGVGEKTKRKILRALLEPFSSWEVKEGKLLQLLKGKKRAKEALWALLRETHPSGQGSDNSTLSASAKP